MDDQVGVLQDDHVRLEPLGLHHLDELVAAASERSSFGWTPVPESRDECEAYIAELCGKREQGRAAAFAVRMASTGRLVGSTRFLELTRWWPEARPDPPGDDPADDPLGGPFDTVEIGGTWYAPAAQGTTVNPAAKLLMLTHAFDRWGVHRVQFKTDARNARSRAAIAKLGASFEGVLRSFQPGMGALGSDVAARDSAVFSVVRGEWSAVRAGLEARLAAPRRP